MWCGVDEVGEGDQGGTEADGGAVERADEDLGVGICWRVVVSYRMEKLGMNPLTESMRDVKVVGHEALQPEAALRFVVWLRSTDGDISSSRSALA